ncbi:MAG: hypothetical protein WC607_04500, partial [Candidatus Micrarchaeia archaeon]
LAGVKAPRSLAFPHYRVCVDTPEDLAVVRATARALGGDAGAVGITRFLKANPDVAKINSLVKQKRLGK